MQEYPRASLLGLPRELRMHIYTVVCRSELDPTIIPPLRDKFAVTRGSEAAPVRNDKTNLHIPWLSLTRVCRMIRAELHSFLSQTASSPATGHDRVWELDLHPTHYHRKGFAWRQLTCPPATVRYLVANLRIVNSDVLRLWGDGGPRPLTRALYQTLNHILHCGPLLDPRRPLAEHLHLHEVAVHVVRDRQGRTTASTSDDDQDDLDESEVEDEQFDAQMVQMQVNTLGGFMAMLVYRGVLFGYVDKMTLTYGDRTQEFKVEWKENARVPREWIRCGFEFGVQ